MPKDKLAFRSHENKDEENDRLNEEDDEDELSRQKEEDDEDDDLRSDDMSAA